MIIAHLPAGYIATKLMQKRFNTRVLLIAGLLGSIFPDLDILYFYLFGGAIDHRHYWTHYPLFWLSLTCIMMPIVIKTRNSQIKHGFLFFITNIFVHLCLDSFFSKVYWLTPFSEQGFKLFSVNIERIFDFWLWNYMAHPIFMVELSICLSAFMLWIIGNKKVLYPI